MSCGFFQLQFSVKLL